MSEERGTGWGRLSGVRIGAVVAIALAAAFVVWLVVRQNDDSSSSGSTTTEQTTTAVGPVAATAARLRALSNKAGPVYWIGPRQNRKYELTRTTSGRIFIRYLPPGAPIGNQRPKYTIVGTYPVKDALDVLRRLSKRTGEKSTSVPGGGLAVYSSSLPTNVYVAYPDSDVQIEVFDPSAQRALRLATSGRVTQVG